MGLSFEASIIDEGSLTHFKGVGAAERRLLHNGCETRSWNCRGGWTARRVRDCRRTGRGVECRCGGA